jgi:hypothetical protein
LGNILLEQHLGQIAADKTSATNYQHFAALQRIS